MAETTYYVDTDTSYASPDGTLGNEFATLNDAENYLGTNITGGNAVVISCKGATADTEAVSLNTWTTDSDSYLKITTDAAHRAGYSWSTSKYRLSITGAATALQSAEDYVYIDGIQAEIGDNTASQKVINIVTVTTGANHIYVSNCYARTYTDTTTFAVCFYLADVDLVADVWNCIAPPSWGYDKRIGRRLRHVGCRHCHHPELHCLRRLWRLPLLDFRHSVVEELLAKGTATADFSASVVTPSSVTYCCSEDTTADAWGGDGNRAEQGSAIVFVSESGTFDFTLSGSDTAATGYGTTPTGFTTNMLGETISTWSIGAYSAPSSSVQAPVACRIRDEQVRNPWRSI